MNIRTASNPAELTAKLDLAQPGDRIELSAADYGALTTSHKFAPPGITIASVDWNAPATFSGKVEVLGAKGMAFDRLLIGPKKVEVIGGSDIAFRNSIFEGALDPVTGVGGKMGVFFKQVIRPVFENNEVFHWVKLFKVAGCDDAVVRFNNFHSFNMDAVNANACLGLLYEGNWMHDRLFEGEGHGDMFQTWNTSPTRPATDYEIRGNFFDMGTGRRVQTIFMRNGRAEGTGDLDLYYKNILIEDNVIYNGHVHGISIGETVGLLVQQNTLLRANGEKNDAPQIRALGPLIDRQTIDNILHKFNAGGQFLVQDTNPGGVNYYGDLFVDAMKVGATLDDLRAVTGGPIETGDFGAELTRIALPFVTGPQVSASEPSTPAVPDDTVPVATVEDVAALTERLDALELEFLAFVDRATANETRIANHEARLDAIATGGAG